MPILPPRKNRGDAIRASEWNALLDALEALGIPRAGRGLSLSSGLGAFTLALIGSLKERVVLAKITAAPPAGVVILPSNCRYAAKGMEKAWEVGVPTLVAPVYGRQVKNDEVGVYPAEVGDYCAIFRNMRVSGEPVIAELCVFTEIPARGPCPEGGDSTAARLDALELMLRRFSGLVGTANAAGGSTVIGDTPPGGS